jgi:asparagine synthase (glutamine-hydrolysing)
MCGICGIVRRDGPVRPGDRDRVVAMVGALAHRGPDASTVETVGRGVLGITRLTIRAPHGGHQPVHDHGSDVLAVCNGEIDNHRELRAWLADHGHVIGDPGDISVLAALYAQLGPDFVQRLVGAFAIAVWHPSEETLLLARDRAGERPLFFIQDQDEIVFATEVAALAADHESSLSKDPEGLERYLRRGVFPAPSSPFREVRKVAPGEWVCFTPLGISGHRYWRWPVTSTAKERPDLEAFDAVFRRAVERQSDVDVEFGVFLSGGVDSSLVAAVARSIRPDHRLQAYTIRFSESSFDEGAFARRVAEDLGIACAEVWVRPEDLAQELPGLMRAVGEPLADPAWIATVLLARRAADDIRVALVGEGGDELFGGYPTYLGAMHAQRYRRLPAPLRGLVEAGIAHWPQSEKKMPVSYLLQRFVEEADREGVARHLQWTATIPLPLLRRLGVDPAPLPIGQDRPGELLDRLQLLDFEVALGEGLLTKADRASMRSALELRAPFLDAGVIDFAASLPRSQRVRGLTTKVFLKRYARRYLPRSIVHRRKRGLSLPLASWLRGPLYEWAAGRLTASRLGEVGIDERAAVGLLEEHRSQQADHGRPRWALLVLSEWLDWAATRTRARGERSEEPVPEPLEQ